MAKYKQLFDEMLLQNKNAFEEFKKIHDNYSKNPAKWKSEFNQKGSDISMIISRFETRLCGKSENCGFGKFSSNLSQKFWEEVRKLLPKIDEVGIE